MPLSHFYPLLKARDSKWLTRLILKDYTHIILPKGLIYGFYHPLLPSLLRIQDKLIAALHFLANLKTDASMVDKSDFGSTLVDILKTFQPRIGIKLVDNRF